MKNPFISAVAIEAIYEHIEKIPEPGGWIAYYDKEMLSLVVCAVSVSNNERAIYEWYAHGPLDDEAAETQVKEFQETYEQELLEEAAGSNGSFLMSGKKEGPTH